jgi:hypothetical protein
MVKSDSELALLTQFSWTPQHFGHFNIQRIYPEIHRSIKKKLYANMPLNIDYVS